MTPPTPPAPDLAAAAGAVATAQSVVDAGVAALAAAGGPDRAQVLAYDVAHAAAAVRTADAVLAYGSYGDTEARIACAFAADALADLAARTAGRAAQWGVAADWMSPAEGFVTTFRDPDFLATVAERPGDRHLDADFELVRETFHRFAEEQIRPRAEHIHRANTDIPEEIISGMADMGGFGMSVPEEYGGFATGGESDYMGMVVATEELSWGSLGAGGSLITRPEILTRAIVHGGTEEQRRRWLPRLASAEVLGAVAVTEPDFGSDVAGLVTAAVPVEGGWLINGVKTWCTFAARAEVLLLLARTDPDRGKAHRGLSLFVVEKPRAEGHGFVFTQEAGAGGRPSGPAGRMEGRAIDTLGYRGMHSYEVAFDNWFVPDANLIGGDSGLGQGFYLQMQGFENGRLQTAARAVGVMQAAYEAAVEYARNRVVFGEPIVDYQLTRVKLARMAILIQAARQFSYQVARLLSKGEGALEASMVKAYVCRAAEWVTREAVQIHGGMGYAEEFPVSRYFVDARVLSIFEGADETLALKVIARRLVAGAVRLTRPVAVDHVSRVQAVRTEGESVVDELESDPSMDTPVPTCEHWTLEDLVVHLGAFCGFWTHILCEGTGRPLTPYPDPPAGAALVQWLDQLLAHLVAELEATPATTEVWTWFTADHTAGFVARRCAHELAVHRYDVQSAHGACQPIPTALALDGIEEILGALVTARDRTGAGTGRTLSLRCTDAPAAWSVGLEPNRIDVVRADGSEAAPVGDLRVTGTASDLELILYHRPTLSPVDVMGDYSVLEEWHREFKF